MKIGTPPPPLKVEVLSSPQFLKIWLEAQPPLQKGVGRVEGARYASSVFSFNSSVSIISLMVIELIGSFLTSSLLSCLVFWMFLEPFCSYKQKNNHYTTNLKHLLQTKKGLQKYSIPAIFGKLFFQINFINKKSLKLLLN